ncbi:MAG: hypothetical protein LBQ64_02020 [Bacteroidales bacterium]|nr:hypothetical protein [Bacteroidales bacterium]
MLGSGNREDIEQQTAISKTQGQTVSQTEKKEPYTFKKPPVLLPENMKVTSVKEVLEKSKFADNQESTLKTEKEEIIPQSQPETVPEEPLNKETEIQQTTVLPEPETASVPETVIQKQETTSLPETVSIPETEIQETETTLLSETAIEETETVFSDGEEEDAGFQTLQECWADAIKEASTKDTIIAEELLVKQLPVATEDYTVILELPNEVARQEVRQIIAALTSSLAQRTGIPYSFDLRIIQTTQETYINKSNPHEVFEELCKQNPHLTTLKQRLDLSIS